MLFAMMIINNTTKDAILLSLNTNPVTANLQCCLKSSLESFMQTRHFSLSFKTKPYKTVISMHKYSCAPCLQLPVQFPGFSWTGPGLPHMTLAACRLQAARSSNVSASGAGPDRSPCPLLEYCATTE